MGAVGKEGMGGVAPERADGSKRALSMDYDSDTQVSRSSKPQHAYVQFHKTPWKERNNEEILMTHTGGTGWRHRSLSAAQGYKEAYPKI